MVSRERISAGPGQNYGDEIKGLLLPRSPVIKTLQRITGDPSVRRTFFVFTLSRVLVLAILLIGGQMGRVVTGSGESVRDINLSLGKIPVGRILRDTVSVADVRWYQGIASRGYEKIPFTADTTHNWAFFPLFPLLWRFTAYLTGEYPLSGMLISHLFFFLGLIVVHKAALAFGFSQTLVDRGLFYLAFFPTSYFYSLPLTESLFLFLTAYSLYSGKRGRWWTAGVAGGLASATRVTGILLLPVLAVLFWEGYGGEWRRKEVWRQAIWRKEVLSLLLVPVGLVCFMIYLYTITGNPFAFKDILAAWGRGTGIFLVTLLGYLRTPWLIAVPWDFRPVNFMGAALALICGAWLLKWRQWTLGVYTLLGVMAPLSSLVLQSQARYAMVLFPMYLVLATAGERARIDETIRTISIALFCLMTALFAAHFSMALA